MENKRSSPYVRRNGSIRVTRPLSRGKHILYNCLGILFLITGLLGIILPVLPTTVFFIIASGFFIKTNPGLYRWLHNNRITGRYLRVYTQGEGMSRKSKAWTIGILWGSLLLSAWIVREVWWVPVILAVVGIGVTWHVATIKPRTIDPEKKAAHEAMMAAESKDNSRRKA